LLRTQGLMHTISSKRYNEYNSLVLHNLETIIQKKSKCLVPCSSYSTAQPLASSPSLCQSRYI